MIKRFIRAILKMVDKRSELDKLNNRLPGKVYRHGDATVITSRFSSLYDLHYYITGIVDLLNDNDAIALQSKVANILSKRIKYTYNYYITDWLSKDGYYEPSYKEVVDEVVKGISIIKYAMKDDKIRTRLNRVLDIEKELIAILKKMS